MKTPVAPFSHRAASYFLKTSIKVARSIALHVATMGLSSETRCGALGVPLRVIFETRNQRGGRSQARHALAPTG
jgi:hypothetical protein